MHFKASSSNNAIQQQDMDEVFIIKPTHFIVLFFRTFNAVLANWLRLSKENGKRFRY
jgi:hypothetical protein